MRDERDSIYLFIYFKFQFSNFKYVCFELILPNLFSLAPNDTPLASYNNYNNKYINNYGNITSNTIISI
jgi:hypothetical protein